jgi:hypothetical protein
VLLGCTEESAVIDQLLSNARSGLSGAIVIEGEAGIGKSALMGSAAQVASGMRVLRISGVESEAEIAFGVLHLLSHARRPHMPLTGASEPHHGLTRCSGSCLRTT